MYSIASVLVGSHLVASTVIAQVGQAGQTQASLNDAAAQRLAAAEAEMTHVLDLLLARAKDDPPAAALLRQAQTAWERYRDAQIAVLWPFPERGEYGSVLPMCATNARLALTEARIRELHRLDSASEGDVCTSPWPPGYVPGAVEILK